MPSTSAWWRSAVTYQLYIRSFKDGDGDGLGDVAGVRSKLPYIAELGVDAIWINPWYPSPQADAGYDVADYRSVDPAFGTLADGQALIDEAHAAGLKVLLDVVPNHTSDEHPWFVAALAAGPGSAERARYHFRPGRGPGGDEPPNDWRSMFGGSAWTRVLDDGEPGEWYLHLFDVKQPDLNWAHPDVVAEFLDVLKFWFDRGADGFRIDVAHGLAKDVTLPDLGTSSGELLSTPWFEGHPFWDRPEVHEIYRGWRALADSYDPPKAFVAEAWVATADRLAHYLRPGQLNTAFDFSFVRTAWDAKEMRELASISLDAHESIGAPVVWVMSNHDITRAVSRFGLTRTHGGEASLHADPTEPVDLVLGRRRARAMIMLMLALPGSAYLYQGEELGLEEVNDLPEDVLQDPTWERSGHTVRGRDGCRVPLPWTSDGPSLGFGTGGAWLPQPAHWAGLSVEAQLADRGSMLWLYREALALRRSLPQLGAGEGPLVWTGDEPEVLGFTRGQGFICMVNTSSAPIPLPPGRVVLSSLPLEGDLLPSDAAAWITT
ncbi:glycoside hydrolase family 13 protein [Spongisporangium articulatum]|uniref:Glycoside hydrolase family 13 protein n=1 Tax=Spongisporangium articulatum TaxID=3362603 RepID=A0ABW8AKI2_9ACTN